MITLSQLYNLGLTYNINIFEDITLPDDSPLDRETLINTIMERCGMSYPTYADPIVYRSAVAIWSAKNQYTFKHIGKIFEAEYSPIENTDRYDSITVNRARDLTDNTAMGSEKSENTESSTNSETTNANTQAHTGSDNTLVEDTTSADNASDYQPKDQTDSTTTYNSTVTDNGTTATEQSATADRSTTLSGTTDKTVDEDETTTTTQHLHGNIGTTTNTLLQTEEYKLMEDYNPYNFLAGLFENELTLFVY